jgi:ABC-type uncharacterized transport system substrate-binding protein
MAVGLARHRVAVIAATGGVQSVRAAKAATAEIPIVFTMGGDPVAFGLVDSLNRPGGNITGITLISGEIVSKRIALLRDLIPGAKKLGVLMNSNTPAGETEVAVAEREAHTLGWQVQVLKVGQGRDLDAASIALKEGPAPVTRRRALWSGERFCDGGQNQERPDRPQPGRHPTLRAGVVGGATSRRAI